MQATLNNGDVATYHPPIKVARHLISHAIRNIPQSEKLFRKLAPPGYTQLQGLKPHEYNDTGKLQFGYQN